MVDMTPTEYAEAVAAEVRAELGRQRKSGSDLAKVLGISPQSIGRRLSGEIAFDVAELSRIATWLGIEIKQLTLSDRLAASTA